MSQMLSLAVQSSTSTLPVMLDIAQVGADRYMCAVVSFNSPRVVIFSWFVSPSGAVAGLTRSSVVMSEPCISISHVFRTDDDTLPASLRFVVSLRSGQVKQVGETQEEDDDDEPVDPDQVFRELPYRLLEHSSWNAATTVYGFPNSMVAALPGTTLKVLQLQHDGHLKTVRTQQVDGLASEPFSKLLPVVGDSNAVMGLCNRSIVKVDLRAPSSVSAITEILQWNPHDPLTCFTIKDTNIFAGAESGAIVVWDLRNGSRRLAENGANTALTSSSAITGIHAVSTSAIVTSGADGTIQQWFRHQSRGGEFTSCRVHPQSATFPFGGVPCVDLVSHSGQICSIDAEGVFSIFAAQ